MPEFAKIRANRDRLNTLREGNARHGDARDGEVPPKSKPRVLILSCMDARVVPERIFNIPAGTAYCLRTLGNTAGNSVLAAIEYAVLHGSVELVVVLGHEDCKAIAATSANLDNEPPKLAARIREIKNACGAFVPRNAAGEFWACSANVANSVRKIAEGSESIRKALDSGRIELRGAIYSISTGRVRWLPVE